LDRAGWASVAEAAGSRYEKEGKWVQAELFYARAAESASDPLKRAHLLNRAGVCAWNTYRNRAAEDRFREALEHVPAGEVWLKARVTANLCMALYMQCRLVEAEEEGRRACVHADASGDPYIMGACRLNLGLVHMYMERPDEALRRFRESRKLFLRAGNGLWAMHALHDIGWALVDLEKYEDAERALRCGIEEGRRGGYPVGRGRVELCRLALARGDVHGAMDVLSVLNSGEALVDPEMHVQALTVAADAVGRLDPGLGIVYAESGLDLALSLGRPPVLYDLLPVLIRLREAVGRKSGDARRLLDEIRMLKGGMVYASVSGTVDVRDPGIRAGGGTDRGGGSGIPQQVAGGASARVDVREAARRWFSRERGVEADAVDGAFLRRMRKAAGMTQEALAELAGCDVRTVRRAEAGRGPERTVRMLAAVIALADRPVTA